MTEQFSARDAARFLRTLRVTTQTALARDEISRGRGQVRPSATFLALAAKGPGEWRFPAAGLMSSDGLVLARLLRENAGAKVLSLQAQGLTGLSTYANKAVRIRMGELFHVDGMFDRDGRLHVVLDEKAIDEADLSEFALELMDGAR